MRHSEHWQNQKVWRSIETAEREAMQTFSLCPVCKKTIPALIEVQEQAVMIKECPDHGFFHSVVENSPGWFGFCQEFNTHKIYDGIMIDVTTACNLKCKYCYHDNNGKHISINKIKKQIRENIDLAPIILTGGEPTIHPDIEEILKYTSLRVETWLLTNGVKLADETFFNTITPYLEKNGILNIGLSFHKESNGLDLKFLELCRKHKKIIGTAFYVIDDINQIDEALILFDAYKDVVHSLRLKAASNLGVETKAINHIFTSDMVNAILARGGFLDGRYSNKVSYASMVLNGKEVKLISWYNLNNVDLIDINGPPYYASKDGKLHNLVTSCLLDSCHV